MRSKNKLLTASQVADILNISPSTLYRWKREGRLPSSIQLGPKTTRWRESEILAFIEQLEAA